MTTTNTTNNTIVLSLGNAAIKEQFNREYAEKKVDRKKFDIDKFLVPVDYEDSDRFRTFFDHMHSNIVIVDTKKKLVWSIRQRKLTLYVLNNVYITTKKIVMDNILNISSRGLDLTDFIGKMERNLVQTKEVLQKPVSDALMVNISMNMRSLLKGIEAENKTIEMVVGAVKNKIETTKTVKILEQALTFSGKYLLGEVFPGVTMDDVTLTINLKNEPPVKLSEADYADFTPTVYTNRTRKTKKKKEVTKDTSTPAPENTTTQTEAVKQETVVENNTTTIEPEVQKEAEVKAEAETTETITAADTVSGTVELALDELVDMDMEIDDDE